MSTKRWYPCPKSAAAFGQELTPETANAWCKRACDNGTCGAQGECKFAPARIDKPKSPPANQGELF